MNINITFFVQVCNFLVAYSLLRQFFFTPIIHILAREGADKKSLLDLLEQQKQDIETQKKIRQQKWHECQDYFRQQRPTTVIVQPFVMFKEMVGQGSTPLSDAEITSYATHVHHILEEKIKHVH